MHTSWKSNIEESKERYLDWWNNKGLVISMWDYLDKTGKPHEKVIAPQQHKDLNQFYFDPEWRSDYLHFQLSKSSFKADILPVANTHFGPGSLAAILGANLEGGEDTVWIKHQEDFGDTIEFNPDNKWWKLHLDLLKACKEKSKGRYFVGCPDLVEGLDILAGLKGNETILMDMMMRPDILKEQVKTINKIYFQVFDQIYDIIQENNEMAYCYFSIWGPGKVAKLQCDMSVMFSEDDFRRFSLPSIREQCQKLDFTLYHLDGVDAIRHLDAILEIEELNAIQWTPGAGEPQGGDPKWYDLYKKILNKGKSVMPCWVELDELNPLLDTIGNQGLNILMNFKTEKDIEKAMRIVDAYK